MWFFWVLQDSFWKGSYRPYASTIVLCVFEEIYGNLVGFQGGTVVGCNWILLSWNFLWGGGGQEVFGDLSNVRVKLGFVRISGWFCSNPQICPS